MGTWGGDIGSPGGTGDRPPSALPSGLCRWGLLLFSLALPACGGEASREPVGPTDSAASPVPCTYPDSRCQEGVDLGGGLVLPVYRTHPLRSRDTTVTRAIVVVHGADRNANTYFATMVETVTTAGYRFQTLVVAPHFQIEEDGPKPNEARWTESGWKKGDLSRSISGFSLRVSSYEAVDRVLQLLADRQRFPRLASVVVTGHSAGGQYTHRFAATSPSEGDFPHLRFRYVVANPSTYLYLTPDRPLPGGGFGPPDRSACPAYNAWHYGLEDRNTYASRLNEEEIRQRLLGRDVVLLVGTADVGTESLDMSCGAMLQGERRYHRGLLLFSYLEARFAGRHHHQLFEVPGIAHSSRGMYLSAQGRKVLFGW